MHWSGKTFAFLIILASLASTVLTAKVIAVRNSWAAKAQKFDTDYSKLAADVVKEQAKLVAIRDDIATTLRDWGAYWVADTQAANAAEGRLQLGIGTNQRVEEGMVIHGFQLYDDPQNPGTQVSIYRGPFRVVTSQADQCQVLPAWRLRPADLGQASLPDGGTIPAWQGGNWRWRSMLPSGYSDQFDDQTIAFTKAQETLAERQQTMAVQNRLFDETTSQVAVRNAELFGGPELAQDEALNAEFREGVVAPLEQTEEARNGVLLSIAELREKVRQERDMVLKLQATNLELTQKLPQPTAETTVSRESAIPAQ
ncbi:hypothetical protein GC163_05035 [bacterium]|nr:hypothetical protein [bacterium]